MGLLILAGVLVYALLLYFVITVCRAAGTMERFYDQLMNLEEPRNDEQPPLR